ncbi:hypothetical protein U3516DRAFT_863819 [Neocallimastix sp. 'constans']
MFYDHIDIKIEIHFYISAQAISQYDDSHNHLENKIGVAKSIVKNKIKDEISNGSLPFNVNINVNMMKFLKKKTATSCITTFDEIPNESNYYKTKRDENFMIFKNNDLIVFQSPFQAELFSKNKHIFADGTFYIAPIFSYQIKNGTGLLKLMDVDPMFIRQVCRCIHNQIIVLVYLDDGTTIGLYIMIEVTATNSFIKTQFYGDKVNAPEEIGVSADAGMGSDLVLDSPLTTFKCDDALDVTDVDAVKKFSKEWFDLDVFLKFKGMEYLTAHWDSYWMFETNFVLYDDPTESSKDKYKFYFIDHSVSSSMISGSFSSIIDLSYL